MKTIVWLLRREIWEHKVAFIGLPMVLAMLFGILQIAVVVYGVSDRVHLIGQTSKLTGIHTVLNVNMGIGMLMIFWVCALIQFLYCVNTLFDERVDRSILFWKSLPSNDFQAVAAKVLMAWVVGPICAVLAFLLFALFVAALSKSLPVIAGLNAMASAPNQLDWLHLVSLTVGFFPGFMLNSLPVIGWALLVSITSPSKPVLWAVGIPLIIAAIGATIWTLFGFVYEAPIFEVLITRFLLGGMASSWHITNSAESLGRDVDVWSLAGNYQLLFHQDYFWPVTLIGAMLLAAVVVLRRRNFAAI